MPSCRNCSLCCTMIGVPELNKLPGERCEHLKYGKCSIYKNRPESCKMYECIYLQSRKHPGAIFPSKLKPSKCNVIFEATKGGLGLVLKVDPNHPKAHSKKTIRDFMMANRMPIFVRTTYTGNARALNEEGLALCRKHGINDGMLPESNETGRLHANIVNAKRGE